MNTQIQHLIAGLRHRDILAAALARHARDEQLRLVRGGHPFEPADMPLLLSGRRAPLWWAALQAGRFAPSRSAGIVLVGGRTVRSPGTETDARSDDREPECTSC